MGQVDVIKIGENILERLSIMAYENFDDKRKVNKSKILELNKQLIFPMKSQANGTKIVDRISEQELRQLFIEEFKVTHPDLYYSIETPTQEKYKFGKSYQDIFDNKDNNIRSASIDMCVFDNKENYYDRLLNIEFKHKNTKDKNIGKDILKLLREKQNGAFILLLNNTDKGTLWNEKNTGVFDKLYKSFRDFRNQWSGETKHFQVVILSLKQKKLIHQKIIKTDLSNLESIFFVENGCGNIESVKGNGWETIGIEDQLNLGVVVEEGIKYKQAIN